MEEKRKDTYIWPELAVSNMEAAQQVKKTVYLYGGFQGMRKDRICEAVSVDQGL